MSISLFALPLHRKRDVVAVRQRARQMARLLGYDPAEQVAIAAAVFELAARARDEKRGTVVHFRLSQRDLQVFCEPQTSLRLVRSLPDETRNMALEDLVWAAQELGRQTPVELFDEMRRYNQELLRVLQELHESRSELEQFREGQRSAA